jgi:hypothetical protein
MYSAIKTRLQILILTCFPSMAAAAEPPQKNLPRNNQPSKNSQTETQASATTTKSDARNLEKSKSDQARSDLAATSSLKSGVSNTAQLTKSCVKLYQKYAIPLQQLWAQRSQSLKGENADGYQLIEDLPPEGCHDDASRKVILELLARILNTHSGKIGVVLPLAGNNYLRHILAGFEAIIRANNLDPNKILVMIDNQSKQDKTTQAVASLVFEHKVSAIIGGTEPADAAVLAKWGSSLSIPTFLLMEPPAGTPQPFLYYAHPTQRALAHAAVEANIRYGHRRIAILSPVDQHSDHFITAYEEAAKSAGVSITQRVPYDAKHFESMEAAARKIFRLDANDRQGELKVLYETAKRRAKETGQTFNAKMVALQPDLRQDAVLIPDTFKIVRHFAKIMTYLGVRKMPLFGHFEWRSQGLISPWDNFMNGSYFVDFQSSYTSMPDPIKIPTVGSPFFVASEKVEQADFSLVGWRAMETPLRLSLKKSEMRRKLDKFVPRKPEDGLDSVYGNDNVLIWEPSTFTITAIGSTSGQLNLLNKIRGD